MLAAPLSRSTASSGKTKQTARVVIIGAGASGIAAATRLLLEGFRNVVLLDAEDRIGGRVNTIPFAANVVDLGAQWCHGEEGNVVYNRVKDLDMLEKTGDSYESYICMRSNGEQVPTEMADKFKSIILTTEATRFTELVDYEGSLGTYLTEKFFSELEDEEDVDETIAKEFFEAYKKFECSVEASDNLFEVSGRGYLEYWLCEGELLLNWRDKGYLSFLRLLMGVKSDKPDDLGYLNERVVLNRRITEINWGDSDEMILRCYNGEVLKADHVICTMSLGVLKEQHSQIFKPALPASKVRAIEGLKLGTVDKFFMEFEKPPLPNDWTGVTMLWREDDLEELRKSPRFWLESVFGFYCVSYQPRVIQGWILGEHARYMETLPEDEVLEAIMWLLYKFIGKNIPQPKNFLRTQWHANPNFRGSYTFRSLYTEELRTGGWDLAEPLSDAGGRLRLQFAGEATHDHYYSTVHGAVESGWREADRLAAFYHTSQL